VDLLELLIDAFGEVFWEIRKAVISALRHEMTK